MTDLVIKHRKRCLFSSPTAAADQHEPWLNGGDSLESSFSTPATPPSVTHANTLVIIRHTYQSKAFSASTSDVREIALALSPPLTSHFLSLTLSHSHKKKGIKEQIQVEAGV